MHFDDDGIENFKRQLKDDGEWSSNAFNSFSNDPSHAANFLARSYKNENNGVFVQVDSGIEQITARDVAHPYWADNPREQEHIYLPGTRFIVQDLLEGPEADERIKALFRERKELLLNASLEKRLLSDYARQELSRYTKKSLESGQPPNAGRNMFVSVVPVQQVIPPYPRQKREQWNADWVQLSSPDKVPERLDQKRRFENVMEFVGDLADTDWVKESIRTGREVRDAKWRAKEASIQAQLQVAKDNVTRQLFTDFPVSDFLRQRLEANPLLIPALTLNDPNTAKKYSEALDAQINLDSDIPF
jgi:hypothetical protein